MKRKGFNKHLSLNKSPFHSSFPPRTKHSHDIKRNVMSSLLYFYCVYFYSALKSSICSNMSVLDVMVVVDYGCDTMFLRTPPQSILGS